MILDPVTMDAIVYGISVAAFGLTCFFMGVALVRGSLWIGLPSILGFIGTNLIMLFLHFHPLFQ
jgi:hypothetical protein